MSSYAKPPPKDVSHHFSRITSRREASNIKDFYKYFRIPGIANVAGGMPNNNYFPFDTLEGAAALPERFQPTPNKRVDPPPPRSRDHVKPIDPAPAQVIVPKEAGTHDVEREIDLKTALQYGTAEGYPPLYQFLRQFTRDNLHPNVPYKDGPEIVLTNGSTDGMSKTIECFANEWVEGRDAIEEKPGMLCEEFIYPNGPITAAVKGVSIVPVTIDNQGMAVKGKGGLEDILDNWDTQQGQRPHLMYTVTLGQNPSSGVLGVQRRKEIYALCQKYDILIIEDDPYWYLQYPSASESSARARGTLDPVPLLGSAQPNYNVPISSGYPFLDSLVPSYLSVDVDGRVIRLDTFSKTVAPGCRLGWVTAQPAIIEKILMITETATQQPSGYVQSMIAQLIMGTEGVASESNMASNAIKNKVAPRKQNGWKISGWIRWLEGLRGEYERRMNTMCEIFEDGRYLVKTGRRPSLEHSISAVSLDGENSAVENDQWSVVTNTMMYDFEWPRAGMFVWIELNLKSHPLARKVNMDKLSRALWVHLTQKPHLVLLAPGYMFAAKEEIATKKGWKYFRISFTALPLEEVADVSRRFVGGMRTFWRRKNLDDIDELAAQSLQIEASSPISGFC